MRCYVGLDVSLRKTNICIINDRGEIVREGETPSTGKDIAAWLRGDRLRFHRLGLEAGAISRSLCADLIRAGLPAICIEAKHAHKILSARLNKTDRNDANGIAHLMRNSTYKAVHVKGAESQRAQATLTARTLLMNKRKDIDNAIGGILRSLGVRVGGAQQVSFEERVRTAARKLGWLSNIVDPLLLARAAIIEQLGRLEAEVGSIAKEDPVCKRFMTAPGVGPFVALTYRSVIDDPTRFKRSKSVGAHLGLTPKTFQSGEMDHRGRISKWGDKVLRAALCNAAAVIMNPRTRQTGLRSWAEPIAARRGRAKAIVALARHLAVILHHMWIDGADYAESKLGAR